MRDDQMRDDQIRGDQMRERQPLSRGTLIHEQATASLGLTELNQHLGARRAAWRVRRGLDRLIYRAEPLEPPPRAAPWTLLLEGELGWPLMALASPPPLSATETLLTLRRDLIQPHVNPAPPRASGGWPASAARGTRDSRDEAGLEQAAACRGATEPGTSEPGTVALALASASLNWSASHADQVTPLLRELPAGSETLQARATLTLARSLMPLLGELTSPLQHDCWEAESAAAHAALWGALARLHGGAEQPEDALVRQSLRAGDKIRQKARRERLPSHATVQALLAAHLPELDPAQIDRAALDIRRPHLLSLHGPQWRVGSLQYPGRSLHWKVMHGRVALVLCHTDASADVRSRAWHRWPGRRLPDRALRARSILWTT